ncbi:MAG: squalene/phytoene synthase family protein [Puniceicoccales bacterium]|nr:squalene/phytoene synthase family protein [Puniceicoccales bacterium]
MQTDPTTLADSYARCLALTRSHYENFPVARLIPRRLQKHVAAIYAFARTADDIADEGYAGEGAAEPLTIEQRLAALREMDAAAVRAASLQGQKDEGKGQRAESAATPQGENEVVPPVAALCPLPLSLIPSAALPPRSPLPAPHSPPSEAALWLFPALGDTLRRFNIPVQLMLDLTSAFAQDVVKRRYADFAEVLDYCRRSANPIGRVVLLLHGYNDPERFAQSDAICTALQLANFWQDIGVDWKKDRRVYLPLDDLARHGASVEDIGASVAAPATPASPALRACIRENVERAQALFDQGRPLAASLAFPLNLEIRATWLGGTTILRKVRELDFDTARRRPRITAGDKLRLLLRALMPL